MPMTAEKQLPTLMGTLMLCICSYIYIYRYLIKFTVKKHGRKPINYLKSVRASSNINKKEKKEKSTFNIQRISRSCMLSIWIEIGREKFGYMEEVQITMLSFLNVQQKLVPSLYVNKSI
jgi:hypothetical protein